MIEPANDMLETLDTVPWLTGARELMRFVGKSNHDSRNLAKFQRAKHFFSTSASRRTVI